MIEENEKQKEKKKKKKRNSKNGLRGRMCTVISTRRNFRRPGAHANAADAIDTIDDATVCFVYTPNGCL